jgi:hypothetical protein
MLYTLSKMYWHLQNIFRCLYPRKCYSLSSHSQRDEHGLHQKTTHYPGNLGPHQSCCKFGNKDCSTPIHETWWTSRAHTQVNVHQIWCCYLRDCEFYRHFHGFQFL